MERGRPAAAFESPARCVDVPLPLFKGCWVPGSVRRRDFDQGVSSNLVREPIEHRGELDEAEEGDGQLLVASGDPTVAFDAGKVVFDRVSVRIEAAVEAIGNAPCAFWEGCRPSLRFRQGDA